MRRALAAGLLSLALAAHAQPSPEPAAPAPQSESAPNPSAAAAEGETPAAEAARSPAPAAEPHPAKPSAPKPPRALPPAPAAPDSTRDAEVTALREEVSRLQSELDAERAAALPAPEDTAAGAPPARGPWGWVIATALLALSAGFVLGWRLLDRRIRRKYGGLRIY